MRFEQEKRMTFKKKTCPHGEFWVGISNNIQYSIKQEHDYYTIEVRFFKPSGEGLLLSYPTVNLLSPKAFDSVDTAKAEVEEMHYLFQRYFKLPE